MNHNYPHISDTKFPDLPSVDVYKHNVVYDYGKYTDSVRIKMLNVSWCGDYDNVVYFETKQDRDAWFENQSGLVKELPTMFRLYSDGTIKVDLPIDECMDYNYVMVDYGKLPNQEGLSDQSKMFYFINELTQASPNATTLHLSVDYWTTFINDMDISYVNLVRGHAPMSETTVDEYLSNPIENSEYLLTNDVNYGEFQRVANSDNIILNDNDILIGFLSNGYMNTYPQGKWNNRVDTAAYYTKNQALSAVDIYAIEVSTFETFRDNVDAQCPQFWETVKGIFIIPRKLTSYVLKFKFCGVTCYDLNTTSDKTVARYDINRSKFNYPSNIANIAKLYTFPYAAIEVNDFKGGSTIIKVEDTVGSLELHTIMCDMYPFLNLEAYMTGIGSGAKSTITFHNVYDNKLQIGGRYYNFTTKWQIPVFAVQLTVDANWKLNGKISADVANTIAHGNAQTQRDNAALLVSKNTASTTRSNTLLNDKTARTNAGIDSNRTLTNSIINATYNAEVEAAVAQATNSSNALTTTASNSANASMINAGISGVGGVVNGAIAGASGGATGVGLGAASGLINGITSFATTAVSADMAVTNAGVQAQTVMNSAMISNDLRENNVVYNVIANNSSAAVSQGINSSMAEYETDYNTAINTINNNYTTATVSNSAGRVDTNADLSWDAAYNQTILKNPPMYGNMIGTPDIISKPFGLSYNVITQSKNAIRQAAEQFLRFGYMLNMEWNIETFNMMPKFTYWECDKVYCNDNGVYEGAQNMIKSILNQGVTVWKTPEDIGNVSIYMNGGR